MNNILVDNKKTISKRKYLIIGILLIILICLANAWRVAKTADFYLINGSFQNYNPVRRFLDGQIPYKDFQDYLGLGHLYIGTLFTFIFGSTFKSSLIAFNFISYSCLAIIAYVIMRTRFSKHTSLAFSGLFLVLAFTVFLTTRIFKIPANNDGILSAFDVAVNTGNSARFIRGLILPITCLFCYAFVFIYKHKFQNNTYFTKQRGFVIASGIIAGFSFIWSNDYGISCWLCLIVMTFWISFCYHRKLVTPIIDSFFVLLISIMCIIVSVSLLTYGHFGEWLHSVFGTGGYQSWYYNSSKSYYLYDLDYSFFTLLQGVLCIYYLFKTYTKFETGGIRKYGILAYCNMACFCAANEYKLLSGGHNTEVARAVLFTTLCCESIFLLLSYLKTDKSIFKNSIRELNLENFSIIICSLFLLASSLNNVYSSTKLKDSLYIEKLGGKITKLGDDLQNANVFLENSTFFSTYSSAQETISEVFQPSGVDYIIHVLGDRNRENYLNSFLNNDFGYAATIKETYTNWEYWVQRANFFWYRELYSNWHPAFANEYEVYWEKNALENENVFFGNISTYVVRENDNSAKIIITTDKGINGIADVYVEFDTSKKDTLTSKFILNTFVQAKDIIANYATNEDGTDYESNFLRGNSKEYIPVTIKNGIGEVQLSSFPEKDTIMNIETVKCDRVFTVTYQYVQVEEINVDKDQVVFTVDNYKKYFESISNCDMIQFNDCTFLIDNIIIKNDKILINTKVDNGKISNVDNLENKRNYLHLLRSN